jgi:hypothetical protein
MKGSDETHGVGLGSSLHGSLLLVLFLKFCLVFCLLDLVVVVVVVGGVVVVVLLMMVMAVKLR